MLCALGAKESIHLVTQFVLCKIGLPANLSAETNCKRNWLRTARHKQWADGHAGRAYSIMYMKRNIISILCLVACVSVFGQNRYDILFNMVHHNPGEPQFTTRFTDPFYLKELGYTGQVPKMEVQCACTYDDWHYEVVPRKTEERRWIERHAARLRMQMKNAKEAGMPVYPFTDMLVLPQTIMEKYGSEIKNEDGQITILKPRTQELVRAQVGELFKRFPDMDGLVIRHGETYLHDTPFHKGGSPARTPEEHALFINILRDEICEKRNKKLFYRTWDFGKLHSQPKLYLETVNAVEPHPNLYFMMKHTQFDFLREYPFNPTIGIGQHRQIVEVSINQAGVYGKNSSPYYIGKGIIEGWPELTGSGNKDIRDLYNDKKIKGFWIWTWGDGWFGPYFDNELWIKLNEFVIRDYVLNPDQTEETIFNKYTIDHLKLSMSDGSKFRELCLLSVDAVFHGQETQLFNGEEWWCRDEFITGLNLDSAVIKNVQNAVLKEKKDNIKNWYHIEALSREIKMSNPEDQEFLEVSSTYGRIKYEIMEQVWIIQMMLSEQKINKAPIDKKKASEAIAAYESKWVEWQKLKKDHACCPTLYDDSRAVHVSNPFQVSLSKLKEIVNATN